MAAAAAAEFSLNVVPAFAHAACKFDGGLMAISALQVQAVSCWPVAAPLWCTWLALQLGLWLALCGSL